MFLASTSIADIGILDSAVVAVLGYAVVFFGLVLLMVVTTILGKILAGAAKKNEKPAAAAPVQDAQPVKEELAPGSAGQLKLHDVPPKTAAMLMAIVADKLGKPLNELRFISIKEDK